MVLSLHVMHYSPQPGFCFINWQPPTRVLLIRHLRTCLVTLCAEIHKLVTQHGLWPGFLKTKASPIRHLDIRWTALCAELCESLVCGYGFPFVIWQLEDEGLHLLHLKTHWVVLCLWNIVSDVVPGCFTGAQYSVSQCVISWRTGETLMLALSDNKQGFRFMTWQSLESHICHIRTRLVGLWANFQWTDTATQFSVKKWILVVALIIIKEYYVFSTLTLEACLKPVYKIIFLINNLWAKCTSLKVKKKMCM